jgi:hypothetical protein
MFSWQKLPEKTCVLLGEPLASSGEMKDSPAHIIPSALGGRLKPKGFLSSRANNLLAQRVDTPFVDAFGQSLTYLAKIKRDRNKGTSTKLIAADKKSWRVSFEKSAIEPAKPDIDVTVLSDKSQSVKFSGTEEQFRQFLKSKNLEQHADKLIPAAIKISEPSPELQLGMKPIKAGHCSLAAWTSAALFAAHKLQI